MPTFYEQLADLERESAAFVLVVLVDALGSTPQDTGAKMLVTPAGLLTGTVGGLMTTLRLPVKDEAGTELKDGTFEKADRYGTLVGKGGVAYRRHAGLCLETGHLPDSVNRPEFPSIILRPGATYTQTCVYRFGVETQ